MNANRFQRGQTIPSVAVALAAIAVVGVAFAILVFRPSVPASSGGVSAASPSPSAPAPSTSPAASPSAPSPSAPAPTKTPASAPSTPAPTKAPSKSPSVEPSDPPSDAPSRIKLQSATGQDVVAAVVDQTGTLTGAVSGHPGDGMSVRWHDSIVEQAGPNAIKVTWVALPQDDQVALGVNDVDGPLTVVIVQAGPVPYSDAMGEDRIVILEFDHAVDADDVVVQVLDQTID